MNYLFTILAFIVLKQCGTGNEDNNQSKEALSGKWKIISIDNTSTLKLDARFEIDLNKNEVVSTVGCNDCFCEIEFASKNKIQLKECVSTEMYCSNLDEYETKMKKALQAISTYEVKGTEISLKDTSKTTRLVLVKKDTILKSV